MTGCEQENIVPILSVIIPVYNTPKEALDRMIQSVLDQEMPAEETYEVIIIDDGSRKDCADYLDEIQLSNNSVIVKHIPNNGVSNARNLGIDSARGKYLTFVDADDYLQPGFFSKSIEIVKQYDADVVYGTISFEPSVFNARKQNKEGIDCKRGGELEDLKAGLLGYTSRSIRYTIYPGPFGRLFRTETAKKIRFRTNIRYCEDQVFNHEFLNVSTVAVSTPYNWYCYVQNDYSLTHYSSGGDYFRENSAVFDVLCDLYKDESAFIHAIACIDVMDKFCFFLISGYIRTKQPWKTAKANMEVGMQHPYIQYAIKQLKHSQKYMTIVDRIQYMLFKHRMYWLIYHILAIIYGKNETKHAPDM